MAQYKDGTYIVKDGELYKIDIKVKFPADGITVPLSDFIKKTNADRIRSMSDEELAEIISSLGNCDTCYLYLNRGCNINTSCKDAVLEWLRKNADSAY